MKMSRHEKKKKKDILIRIESGPVRCERLVPVQDRNMRIFMGDLDVCEYAAIYSAGPERRAYCWKHVPKTAKVVRCLFSGREVNRREYCGGFETLRDLADERKYAKSRICDAKRRLMAIEKSLFAFHCAGLAHKPIREFDFPYYDEADLKDAEAELEEAEKYLREACRRHLALKQWGEDHQSKARRRRIWKKGRERAIEDRLTMCLEQEILAGRYTHEEALRKFGVDLRDWP